MLRSFLTGLVRRIWSTIGKPEGAAKFSIAADATASLQECVRLADTNRIGEACACYQRLLQIDPSYAKAHNNLGALLHRRGDFDGAVAALNRAVKADPSLCEPHVNLGNVLQDRGDLAGALNQYDAALALDPSSAQAHYCRGTTLLAMGEFETGWQEYEWRRKLPAAISSAPHLGRARWNDRQDLADKTLLVFVEQGFGDTIQFLRYVTPLSARGAHVVVACQSELISLAQTVPGVGAVRGPGELLPDFDYQIPLLSLPFAFRTTLATIPARVPYLFPDPQRVELWRARLDARRDDFKVGLVWGGNPRYVKDTERSCPSRMLARLCEVPRCLFFSLQKGDAAGQIAQLRGAGAAIADFSAELHDFHDTAAFVSALDLVIGVDTAVIHLAGALGKPVWTMLPYSADWRWFNRVENTPWYPTMRLFRQPVPDDWDAVVRSLRQALADQPKPGAPAADGAGTKLGSRGYGGGGGT